jgi:hypothetical protein
MLFHLDGQPPLLQPNAAASLSARAAIDRQPTAHCSSASTVWLLWPKNWHDRSCRAVLRTCTSTSQVRCTLLECESCIVVSGVTWAKLRPGS